MSAEPERKDPLAALASLRIERNPAPSPERPTRIRWGLIVAILLAGGVAAAVWRPARRLYQEQTLPPPETALIVRTGGPDLVLTGSGYVNADAVVDVGTTVAGRLKRLTVKKGDRVKRGQLLALIDDEELQAQRMLAKANLDDARRSIERAAALLETGAGTPQEVDKSQAALEVAQASLQLIDARIKQTRILAPTDAKVLDTLADPGEILSSFSLSGPSGGPGLVRLGNLEKTVVEVDVNETDIRKLEIGQPAQVTLDAYPDRIYEARLQEIAQIADRAKGTVQVKVRLAAPDDNVRPNMAAKVVFRPEGADLSQKGRLLVSRRALLPGGAAVFVVRKGRLERRTVGTKPAEGDFVEIAQGLAEGEMILTSQLDRWQDGADLPQPNKE